VLGLVIDGAVPTGSVNWPLFGLPPESVTVTVKVDVTAVCGGMPVSSPVELSAAQGGSPVADQMPPPDPPDPPVARNWYRYADPTMAVGSVGGLKKSMATGNAKDFVPALPAASLTVTEKLTVDVPAGGTPVRTPPGLSVNHGKPVAFHRYPDRFRRKP
jgi:hypothetical protein